jgi:hypothetical protein
MHPLMAHIAEDHAIVDTAQERICWIAQAPRLIRDDMMCVIEEVGETPTTMSASIPLSQESFPSCSLIEIKWSRHSDLSSSHRSIFSASHKDINQCYGATL